MIPRGVFPKPCFERSDVKRKEGHECLSPLSRPETLIRSVPGGPCNRCLGFGDPQSRPSISSFSSTEGRLKVNEAERSYQPSERRTPSNPPSQKHSSPTAPFSTETGESLACAEIDFPFGWGRRIFGWFCAQEESLGIGAVSRFPWEATKKRKPFRLTAERLPKVFKA